MTKSRLVTYGFLLIPLWWAMGVGFFIFHAVALFILITRPGSQRPRDAFQWSLIALINILFLSLILNQFFENIEISRAVGAINNISILVIGYVFYSFFRHSFNPGINYVEVLSKYAFIISCLTFVIGAICFAYTTLTSNKEFVLPSLFGLFTPRFNNLIGLYQNLIFISPDWFAETTTPRIQFLSTNATSSAALFSILGFMALGHVRAKHPRLTFPFILLLILLIAISLTRGAFVGAFTGSLMFTFFLIKKKYHSSIILLLILLTPLIAKIAVDSFETLSQAREGSNSSRLLSYELAVNMTLDASPLIGMGVKPRTDDIRIPVGSHSTLASTLIRGGLIGTTLAVVTFYLIPLYWLIKILAKYYKRRKKDPAADCYMIAIVSGTFSFLLFCTLQDIDAYAPVSSVFFTYLALLSHFSKDGSISQRTYHQPIVVRSINHEPNT